MTSSLKQQIQFLLEIDKLKTIIRRNYIADGSKRENDAEHSWFFAVAAMILAEHSNEKVDIDKVIRMGLIHDMVEVYAGDTFIYDEAGKETQKQRETEASYKIFGILPQDQKKYFLDLWNEFEEGKTNEAKYAKAIDRLSAVLLNLNSNGKSWKENSISFEKVYQINSHIAQGSMPIWEYISQMLEDGKNEKFYKENIQ